MNEAVNIDILIVDTNPDFYIDFVKDFKHRVTVHYVDNPLDGLSKCTDLSYAIIISHECFDEMSGQNFLITAKKINNNIRTVLLIDTLDDTKEMKALNQGVDLIISRDRQSNIIHHYMGELIDSISFNVKDVLISKHEGLKVDLQSYEVYKNDVMVMLTPKEFSLLVMFLKNKNIALERKKIISVIWEDIHDSVDERTIDVHIKRLREKLNTKSIQAVRGVGYKWFEGQL